MNKFKNWLNNLIKIIKFWFTTIVLPILVKTWKIFNPWLIKNWFLFTNYSVIFLSYLIVRHHDDISFVKFILGAWMVISIIYAGIKWLVNKE